MADRIPYPCRLRIIGKLSAIRVYLTVRVALFVEHRGHRRSLNDFERKIIIKVAARNALRDAARRWTLSVPALRVFAKQCGGVRAHGRFFRFEVCQDTQEILREHTRIVSWHDEVLECVAKPPLVVARWRIRG